MTGTEIDFVVPDSILALDLYRKIFDVAVIEATDIKKGQNEAVFSIYGTRFHMLDENHEFHLFSPQPGAPVSVWFNIFVADINPVHDKAVSLGCAEIQSPAEMPEMGVSNSMFTDPFGYIWMLHQIHGKPSL